MSDSLISLKGVLHGGILLGSIAGLIKKDTTKAQATSQDAVSFQKDVLAVPGTVRTARSSGSRSSI